MRVNPGGNISPEDMIGRDEFIEELWSTLSEQSLVLSSERRTGKTSVLKKMEAVPAPNTIPIYRDLESIHSAHEFVNVIVNKDLERYLSIFERLKVGGRWLKDTLRGFQLGSIKIPENDVTELKMVLMNAFQSSAANENQILVLLWDELPMMLENIRKRAGEETAMEMLNILRSIRQQFPHVRMIFTGSIGIHHVITRLKDSGYHNDATNDMAIHELLPLTKSYAEQLAKSLLVGEAISTTDLGRISAEIAIVSGGIPYYIHHVIKKLKFRKEEIAPGMADQVVVDYINSADDPWHLGHYLQRLNIYYKDSQCHLAIAILDVLAMSSGPIEVSQLLNLVRAKMPVNDNTLFQSTLRTLELDHYIVRDSSGYKFRLEIVRRWWQARNQ